jgi:hypothetical protein
LVAVTSGGVRLLTGSPAVGFGGKEEEHAAAVDVDAKAAATMAGPDGELRGLWICVASERVARVARELVSGGSGRGKRGFAELLCHSLEFLACFECESGPHEIRFQMMFSPRIFEELILSRTSTLSVS